MARTWVNREPPDFGNVDMVASRVSSALPDAMPPSELTSVSVSESNFGRSMPSRTRSAPMSVRACS